MPNPNAGPRIIPATAQAAGIEMQGLCVVDPQTYPHGMEVTFTAPGSLEPIGHFLIAPGCVVAALPPETSRPLIEAHRRHVAAQRRAGPGEVKAPGFGG